MIIRGPRKERDFTILSNAVLRDARLSFKARGMLVYGLSQPVDYRMTREELAAASPSEGEKSIRNGLDELAKAGYLVRRRLRAPDGSFSWESVLYEERQNDTSEVIHTAPPTGGSGPLALTSTNGAEPQVAASGPSSPVAEGPSSTEVLGTEGLKDFGGAQSVPPKRACQFPDTWQPKASHKDMAVERDLDWRAEAEQFEDHHRAKGSLMKDWDRAFNTWLRNAGRFSAKDRKLRVVNSDDDSDVLSAYGLTRG